MRRLDHRSRTGGRGWRWPGGRNGNAGSGVSCARLGHGSVSGWGLGYENAGGSFMTPVSRVPHGTVDFLWLMGHRSARFEGAQFGTGPGKSLCDSCLAEYGRRQVNLAVGLLYDRMKPA